MFPSSDFPPTQWSLVRRAAGSSAEARAACGELCERYWYPIYLYLRRSGRPPDAAADLTQGFFADFLARERPWANAVRPAADPGDRTFRGCLIMALRSYLSEVHREATTAKSGGGRVASFDAMTAEERYVCEPAARDEPAEVGFARAWAEKVLATALADVRAGYDPARFEVLKVYLSAGDRGPSYSTVAALLKLSEVAVKKAVSRLRATFAAAVRSALADTVDDPADVDAELRDLFAAVARPHP